MDYEKLKSFKLNPNLDSLIIGCMSFDNTFDFSRGKHNGYYHLFFEDFVPGMILSLLHSKFTFVRDVTFVGGLYDVTLIFFPEL